MLETAEGLQTTRSALLISKGAPTATLGTPPESGSGIATAAGRTGIRPPVERAIELGWHEERVRLVDDEQGLSAENAGGRQGFEELVGEVPLGYAGIVLAYEEASRLARNNPDRHALLEVAAVRGTPIADPEGVYD